MWHAREHLVRGNLVRSGHFPELTDVLLAASSTRRTPDLRRTLALYEDAIRPLTLGNAALRRGATVHPMPSRTRTARGEFLRSELPGGR